MQKISLALLFLIYSTFAKAQITYVKGYMVPLKGDTMKGEVKVNPKKEQDNYSKLGFKDASGGQKNYKPEKVKAYGYGDKHYVSFTVDNETKYYRRLCDGFIKFYKVAFEINSANETTYDYDYFIMKEGDKKLTNVKQNKFKKQMQEWMAGNPEIANEYQEAKEFNEQSAVNVINKYNDWKKNN